MVAVGKDKDSGMGILCRMDKTRRRGGRALRTGRLQGWRKRGKIGWKMGLAMCRA